MSSFEKHDVQVFGITHNDIDSHQKFTEQNNLNFPLLVDTNKNLAYLFGAAEEDKDRYKRITVIVDKTGKIVKIDKEVNPATHGLDLVNYFKNNPSTSN